VLQQAKQQALVYEAETKEELQRLRSENEALTAKMELQVSLHHDAASQIDPLQEKIKALEQALVEKEDAIDQDVMLKLEAKERALDLHTQALQDEARAQVRAAELRAKEVEERSQEAVAQASREAAEYIVQKEEEVRLQLEEETAKAENAQARAEAAEAEILHARRIQHLHNSTDIARTTLQLTKAQNEVEELKYEVQAKSVECEELKLQLQKFKNHRTSGELRRAPSSSQAPEVGFGLLGDTVLGSTLRVTGTAHYQDAGSQWYRMGEDGGKELIAGATRAQYAPEPRDVGFRLGCALTQPVDGTVVDTATPAAIRVGDGLQEYVNTLLAKGGGEFNVVIVQLNGSMQDRKSVFQLEVLHGRLKIKRNGKTKYKEHYSQTMQVCGARGGGDAAAQGLFLALSSSLVFMLACESSRERNAAIMLIRRFALESNIQLGGPEDSPSPTQKH